LAVHSAPQIHEIDGKRFFLAHGDGLGPGDKGFKFLKRIYTSRPTQFAFRTLHPDAPGLTFPVWNPHVRLDYLFLPSNRRAALVASEVVSDGPVAEASDHLPLLTELAV